MLDIEKIRQLVDMMVANDLVEVSLRDGEQEIHLRRPNGDQPVGVPMIQGPAMVANAAPSLPEETPAPEADDGLVEIRSPMVGKFYASPDPESPPFVQPGSAVQGNSVVCIVEAMKVFNEIKAELSGTIERCLVDNEQSVEYGQPLFLVRPT